MNILEVAENLGSMALIFLFVGGTYWFFQKII